MKSKLTWLLIAASICLTCALPVTVKKPTEADMTHNKDEPAQPNAAVSVAYWIAEKIL